MEHNHMAPTHHPSQFREGEQWGTQVGPEPVPSTLAPQRLPGPAALATIPSPPIQSPPQYHQHSKFIGDHVASPSNQHSVLTLRPLNDPAPELPPIQPRHERSASGPSHTLPSLSSVTSGLRSSPDPGPVDYWPSLNPYTAFYAPGHMPPTDAPSRIDTERVVVSPERHYERRSASISLDDPDVRMAAEALGDLRADFVSSPPDRNTPLPGTPRDPRTASPRDSASDTQAEPLLSLITASHPLLATTIEGAASAYNQSKNYSPHLRTGAEYIEDYLTPIAKVVGNVGRKTGVEGGVRWILGGVRKPGRKHQSGDLEAGGNKRRRAKLSDKEKEAFDRSFPEADRRMSVSTIDTLPAYDDHRSPAYSEALDGTARPASSGSEWKTRIVVSTSGLGVAMRAESLVRLKYCLRQLRQANSLVGSTLNSLQSVVEQYDAAKKRAAGGDQEMAGAPGSSSAPISDEHGELLVRMDRLKNEIVSSLGTVIALVSTYAGSALPENVRNVIREQFTGLPQRFRAHLAREGRSDAGASGDQETAMREGARGVLVLARDGLQMITHVSDVIDRTIQSAEEWCTAMGKDKTEGAATPDKVPSPAQWATQQPVVPTVDGDIHMTD